VNKFLIFTSFLFCSLIFAQTESLNSKCLKGDCLNGEGKIIYENQSTYEGYFKDGFRHGQGTLIEESKIDLITSKGLFIYDKIIQGNKVIKNIKHGFESLVTVTYKTYSGKINDKTYLYSGPSKSFKPLLVLNPESKVLILNDKDINNFYNVIDIESNIEGYVFLNNVDFIEEQKVEKNNVFDVIGNTTDIRFCEIEIYNSHNTLFILKLDTESFSFEAGETRTITIKPGSYRVFATSKGVRPYIGEINLERGKKYYRRYYVIRSYEN